MSLANRFEKAIDEAVAQFHDKLRAIYIPDNIVAMLKSACSEVDASGYNMKSKFRRALYENVEREVPRKMRSTLDSAIDVVIKDLRAKVGEIADKEAGCDASMSKVRILLERLRVQLRDEIVQEETEAFKTNLAIAGVAILAGTTVGTLSASAGGGAWLGPLGMVGGAILGAGIVAGRELTWDPASVRNEFIEKVADEMKAASSAPAMCQSFERLLRESAKEMLKVLSKAADGAPPAKKAIKPVAAEKAKNALVAEKSQQQAEHEKVKQAKKYVPFDNILWHDPNITNSENQSYLDKLRGVYPHIIGVANAQEAANTVQRNPLTAFTIMTSGSKAREFVPLVHNLLNVKAIHVFCSHKAYHETQPWFTQNLNPNGKILGIYTNISPVVDGLAKPLPRPRISFIKEEDLARCVQEALSVYLHSQVHDFVEKVPFEDAVAYLLEVRKSQHGINASDSEIKRIARLFDPFEGRYKELLKLYTEEEVHIYDTLNTELRQKKRDPNFLKLAKLAEQFLYAMQLAASEVPALVYSGAAYRATWIADEEVGQYENSVGKFIFFRAFTSTSTVEGKAAPFATRKWHLKAKKGKKLMLVLDCSSLDRNMNCIRPMSVKPFSDFPDEEEILIPLLSGFQVVNVTHEADAWMRVHLKLAFTMPDMTAAFIYAFI